MEQKKYQQIQEVIYQQTLANGLQITLIPKPHFHKTYGLFTTNYGSIDNEFVPLGGKEFIRVPDGIAHFLEHKMFEKKEGDVFQVFSKLGAAANAFTSFTRTSYLFSTTDLVTENLKTLLNFVQDPYFTPETVEKEKGIIGQEIEMYQDDPDWRLFFGIIGNLYPDHPLHIDIAGTQESIAEITADDLYTCYRTFYHPSNMNLLVVGNFIPEQIMELIEENQAAKSFAPPEKILRRLPVESLADIIPTAELKMPIVHPKAILGIKGVEQVPTEGFAHSKYRTTVDLLLQMLLGPTSHNYMDMYNKNLLDASFSCEFSLERGFHFIDIGGDTSKPAELVAALRNILLHTAESKEMTEERLELLKRKMLGQYLQSLNSLEYIANQFSRLQSGETTLFDTPEIIASVTMEDVQNVAAQLLAENKFSEFYIYPEATNE